MKSIKNINITINKNEVIGIIGKSGSGKTTLLNNISNLLKFDTGEIVFDSTKIFPNQNYILKNLSYIRQIYLLDDTIRNNILFGEEENENSDNKIQSSLIKLDWRNIKINLI